jgi:prepilin-type N-terminal cleavage/methylation domain-containing protein
VSPHDSAFTHLAGLRRRRVSSQSGVTLMEVLVAVTLLSLLSVGILFATRIGLNAMDRSQDRLRTNRRVLGVERILTQQIAGFIPVKGDCFAAPPTPPARLPLFQGEPMTMRFVSTYSLDEASRGYPRLLEFQVIPGENGEGVRLVVNELLYSGPRSAGVVCAGVMPGPPGSGPQMIFRPVQITPASFVLADNLASCRFLYKEEREFPHPDLWYERWTRPRAPNAIRIDMAPLSSDPSRLEVPTIVAPIRTTRDPDMKYVDVEPE